MHTAGYQRTVAQHIARPHQAQNLLLAIAPRFGNFYAALVHAVEPGRTATLLKNNLASLVMLADFILRNLFDASY
jgi:hypothetical protein